MMITRVQFGAAPSTEKSCSFLCRKDNQTVGFALGCVTDSPSMLRVLSVKVNREHRRQGIGTALMQKLLEEAVSRGMNGLMLHVKPSNTPALSLYRKMGFTVEERVAGYYDDADAYRMTRDL
mgnify:CR=1 FL=1